MYPALAVAAALRERVFANAEGHNAPHQSIVASAQGATSVTNPSNKIIYVGSEDGMERQLVPQESDLPFRAIPAAALRGRAPWTLVRNLGTMARGTRVAQQLIDELRPAAILGTGGYVCVPLFLAARNAGVPTIIYLPDVIPGMAVKVLARLSTWIACNVEDSAPYFGFIPQASRLTNLESKTRIVGYPVRTELFDQDQRACRATFDLDDDLPVVFVNGGSRGARSINKAIAALLEHILPFTQIIHMCGREGDEQFLQEAVGRLPKNLRARYRLYPYLYSKPAATTPTMVGAFGAATLVVCRSGASTMAELPAARLPSILIPYPYVNQEANADYLVRHGAAIKIQDSAMLGDGRPEEGPLYQAIERLLTKHEERTYMSERGNMLARPDAAQRLASMLFDVAARRSPA
ncbi:MAG: UDP-N-acetylglucosamine--N-acetylmuramyl-(pentapeptide) pyrophosphoryl-undecaprenol N-acetylglucosamine transferase [Chloroflexota bacterium]